MIERADSPRSLLQKAEIAFRSSTSIQDICNQLLNIYQHRNSDNLMVASYAVGELAGSVVHSFYELLNSLSITLHYDKEKKIDTEIWVRHKRIEFILQCKFSGAYRHISYSGAIWFTINVTEINNKKYCLFTLKDNGQSIEESFVMYLSNANNSAEDKSFHSELALDVMEMAQIHHDDIKIDRQKDVGTTVTLYIPLDKERFAEDKNVIL